MHKRRRSLLILLLALAISFLSYHNNDSGTGTITDQPIKNAVTAPPPGSKKALEALGQLAVKGRAPKTGYSREMFMDDWRDEGGCDKRNIILQRDLINTVVADNGCIVISGELFDPYTAKSIPFLRGAGTSSDIQIDHIVALADAWQKGAQQFSYKKRNNFASDALNLLAVDGPANMQKGAGDTATWLPPNKAYRCAYVSRQTAVKLKYDLWVTEAEKNAIARILNKCPDQVLPLEND